MIQRRYGYLEPRRGDAPAATHELHERGFVVLKQALTPAVVEELAKDIGRVFDEQPRDGRMADRGRPNDAFRYEMLNRSAACQRAVAKRRVLDIIEPLLGADCHVIANTAWRNGVDLAPHGGEGWHTDGGPHVPRPPGTRWPDEIPYPVFAIGAHFFLLDCRLEDGPTGAIPGSHRSGQHPPFRSMMDGDLRHEGEGCVPLLANAGDVALFVSDIWHRRLPTTTGNHGRYFLQVHYARRDIAQRLKPSTESNQLSGEAAARARTRRERRLIGLHSPGFYDG